MKPSSKQPKTENLKEISFSKLSRIGILEKVKLELIKEELIKKTELTNEEEDIQVEKWLNSNLIKNSDQLKEWQKNNLQSYEDWRFFITRDIRWEKWCIKNFNNKIDSYYKERKPFLDKYIYSIIRVKNHGLSKELYLRIKNKESDFYSTAVEFSEGVENRTGGLIGPVNLNTPHPIIANILKESKNKQLWPPTKINEWWVIIRLEERKILNLDEKLKIKLSEELGDIYLRKELNKFRTKFDS